MVLQKIYNNLNPLNKNTAFVIEEQVLSYTDLQKKVAGIQSVLIKNNIHKKDIILVETHNDIETYASILAIWFLGATFVPINPKHAKNRNDLIENQIDFKIKLSSINQKAETLNTKNLESNSPINDRHFTEQILYILFTSGSTGIPKGVPISTKNLNAFIQNFTGKFDLNTSDKFLQIYDLTFDASVHCYVLPLFLGASIYTVSPNKIKYLEAYKLMEKHQLTFAKFPPSVLTYLQAFFNRIQLPNLKYSLLGGESLQAELAEKWQKCLPNGEIYNVYGPTEATINTHIFNFTKNYTPQKSVNGIVCIGKPFGKNKAFVLDENNRDLPKNKKGELGLSGTQITNRYYNNLLKNNESFITINKQHIYKTGDLVSMDNDGDFMFYGRKDNQIQIQGYRVELSEIEYVAKQYGNAINYAVVAVKNQFNVMEILLFSEKLIGSEKKLHQYLQNHLPNYMLPSKISNLEDFPITSSGKIDYQSLKKMATENES